MITGPSQFHRFSSTASAKVLGGRDRRRLQKVRNWALLSFVANKFLSEAKVLIFEHSLLNHVSFCLIPSLPAFNKQHENDSACCMNA